MRSQTKKTLSTFLFVLLAATQPVRASADWGWPHDRDWGKPFAGPLESRKEAGNLTLCNDIHGFPAPTPGRDCVPEVTYAWGSAKKADLIFNALEGASDWNVRMSDIDTSREAFFTALSPISTFYYGEVPLRVKFRPGTVFEPLSLDSAFTGVECRRVKKKKRQMTTPVFLVEKPLQAIPGARMYEVVLCSFDSVESISRATREHYDETLRDLYRLNARDPKKPADQKLPTYTYIQYRTQFEPFSRPLLDLNFEGRSFVLTPFSSGNEKSADLEAARKPEVDQLPLDDGVLGRNLLHFFESARDGKETKILYNPALPEHPSHFEWKNPLWFSK